MKLWVFLMICILGSLTNDANGQSGTPNSDDDATEEGDHQTDEPSYGDPEIDEILAELDMSDDTDDDDDEDGDDNDDDDENNDNDDDENDDDDEEYYEFDCGHFNLEMCIHDYAQFDDIGVPDNEDPLCWESYITAMCLHDYAEACFEDSPNKEEYLCKIKNFQDRIQVLCLNETYEDEEPTDEEVLECLEGAEVDAEECVEIAIPKIANLIKEKKVQADITDFDSVKCLVMQSVMECTVDRLEERCPKEVIDGFREGAEEAINEIVGSNCEVQTITDVPSVK